MKSFAIVAVASFFLLSCTSTKVTTIEWSPDTAYDLARLNYEIGKREANLTMASGDSIMGSGLSLKRDSTTWMSAIHGRQRIGTRDIMQIRVRRKSGKGIGLFGGMILGALVGTLTYNNREACPGMLGGYSESACWNDMGRAVSGIIGGLLGSLLGYVVAPGPSDTHYIQRAINQD